MRFISIVGHKEKRDTETFEIAGFSYPEFFYMRFLYTNMSFRDMGIRKTMFYEDSVSRGCNEREVGMKNVSFGLLKTVGHRFWLIVSG